ncbi:MAG: alanyl-tRNA editing protein [Pseudomonadota bacterium]
MTILLFQDAPMLKDMNAAVIKTGTFEDTPYAILDQTVFYPTSGGQAGDTGTLTWSGKSVHVIDTRKSPDGVMHLLDGAAPAVGTEVRGQLDWERRWAHMRLHTSMHLLCACIDNDVTGGRIGADKAHLDFDLEHAPDKQALNDKLSALVAADHPITVQWEDDLSAVAHLVRTADKTPPQTDGAIRLVRIGADEPPVDLQPCGGTHVARTSEIGAVHVKKIENKGKRNRRVILTLAGA